MVVKEFRRSERGKQWRESTVLYVLEYGMEEMDRATKEMRSERNIKGRVRAKGMRTTKQVDKNPTNQVTISLETILYFSEPLS